MLQQLESEEVINQESDTPIEHRKASRAKREIWGKLGAVQQAIPGIRARISRRGVPHLVGELSNGRRYSVCYFKTHHSYTVFFPYAEWVDNQEKVHVKGGVDGISAVIDYLEETYGNEDSDAA